MNKIFTLISRFACIAVLLIGTVTYAQQGFKLPENKVKDKISFNLVNNLVVVPVEVNGVKLSFLLDTGVNATILFDATTDTLELQNARRVTLRGLGEGNEIEALESRKNTMKVGDATDENHRLYVIIDEEFNLSDRMGVPVHGILGYDFFKNFIVRTNYISSELTIYKPENYKYKNCKKCDVFELEFHNRKPYVNSVYFGGDETGKMLLVDSGSSDAVWLFDENGIIDNETKNYFDDYLGLGLSGAIYGKRSKIDSLKIGNAQLNRVTVALPSEGAMENINFVKGREGSIGANLLNRFHVIIDYTNKKMVLKKNSKFKDPFYYNMSGLTIEHDGTTVVQKTFNRNTSTENLYANKENPLSIINQKSTQLFLTPKIVVADVRTESPAYEAGIIKGDEILLVNGKPAFQYGLNDLNSMFSTRKGRKISMVILSDGVRKKKRFTLVEMF